PVVAAVPRELRRELARPLRRAALGPRQAQPARARGRQPRRPRGALARRLPPRRARAAGGAPPPLRPARPRRADGRLRDPRSLPPSAEGTMRLVKPLILLGTGLGATGLLRKPDAALTDLPNRIPEAAPYVTAEARAYPPPYEELWQSQNH